MSKKKKTPVRFAPALAAAVLAGLLLAFSETAARQVGEALNICGAMLIPSLFPLTVAAELATQVGAAELMAKPLERPLSKMLGISRAAVAPYFLGLVGGYTASCRSAVLLYENGKISRADCESVIALSNLPSMGFVVGFVGGRAFGDVRLGWTLWAIAVASTVPLGLINRAISAHGSERVKIADAPKPPSTAAAVVEAIEGGVRAMLLVCGCVVFFSVVRGIFAEILPLEWAKRALGALEITQGVLESAAVGGRRGAVLCAANIGFSGVCVHCQVVALTESAGLKYRKYFVLKLAQAAICAALAAVIF